MNPLRWLAHALLRDPERPPQPDDLVLLAEPDGELVGDLWRSQLESAGITSLRKNVSPIAYLGAEPAPMYELHVRYRDLARASAILGLRQDTSGDSTARH